MRGMEIIFTHLMIPKTGLLKVLVMKNWVVGGFAIALQKYFKPIENLFSHGEKGGRYKINCFFLNIYIFSTIKV